MYPGHYQIVRVGTDLTLLQSVINPPGTSAGSSGFLCLNLWVFKGSFYPFAWLCNFVELYLTQIGKLCLLQVQNLLVTQHQTFPSELVEKIWLFIKMTYPYLSAFKIIITYNYNNILRNDFIRMTLRSTQYIEHVSPSIPV